MSKRINVTKTFLPPQEEYQNILAKAWETSWMTNRGELVKKLEENLKNFLGVSQILLTTNGTLPLQIAIKALQLKGEIITTPFSYVATTSSIVWENCTPVFADIHPDYLSIDETKIESLINQNTSAILATHVFGNPCDVVALKKIADKHGLKIIYDAAHCFGVQYLGESVFNYGDISTCSFHATKLFHTVEGGAIFTTNQKLLNQLFSYHNFGHDGPENFQGLGINAKMSELQAAMGLAILPYMDRILEHRKSAVAYYDFNLKKLRKLKLRDNCDWNYSYYPIILENEHILNQAVTKLRKENVFPRRYFYPSLNTLPYVKKIQMPNSEAISKTILCLPLSSDISKKDQDVVIKVLRDYV